MPTDLIGPETHPIHWRIQMLHSITASHTHPTAHPPTPTYILSVVFFYSKILLIMDRHNLSLLSLLLSISQPTQPQPSPLHTIIIIIAIILISVLKKISFIFSLTHSLFPPSMLSLSMTLFEVFPKPIRPSSLSLCMSSNSFFTTITTIILFFNHSGHCHHHPLEPVKRK